MLQMYVIASGQRNNMNAFAKADIYLHVAMKKIYNFLEKSELPNQSSYLRWKLVGLLFPSVSEMEMKNLLRSNQAHFLVARRRSISRLRLRARSLFNVNLLAGYHAVFLLIDVIY